LIAQLGSVPGSSAGWEQESDFVKACEVAWVKGRADLFTFVEDSYCAWVIDSFDEEVD